MKSVCKYCGQSELIKWGNRRRYCEPCDRTFRVPKSGRKKTRKTEMYLLDRSTFRRIGFKTKSRDTTILRGLHKELEPVEKPTDFLKKIYIRLPVSWSLTPNMYQLKELDIVSS